MGKPFDLEALREVFRDKRIHIALGVVESLDLATDRSVLRVKCTTFPDMNKIIAKMSWEHVGPDAGIYGFPSPQDLVLLAFGEGDIDSAFVIRRLTSKVDKIPLQAVNGDLVVRALAGKKAHVLSDSMVLLGRGGSDPTEPLVLGLVFKAAYSSHLQLTADHMHIGNMGFVTTPPDNAAQFLALKSDPVDNDAMLSDLAKTEK